MKHIYIPIFAATLLFAFSACSDVTLSGETPEKPIVPEKPSIGMPLQIEVENSSVTTRSILMGDRFTHESQVNVWLLDPEGTATPTGDYGKSMLYQYKKPSESQGVWIAMPETEDDQMLVTSNPADVLAHYPAQLPQNAQLSADKRTLTIPLNTTKTFGSLDDYNGDDSFFHPLGGSQDKEVLMAPGEVDYMTGSGNQVGSTTKSTTIQMKHNLSIVILHIYKDPQNSNPGIVKSFSLKNAGSKTVLATGSFDVATAGFVRNSSQPVSYQASMSGFPEGMYFGIMVYPTASFDKGDVELKIEVDNSTYTFQLEASEWQAGFMTLYEVKLNPTAADISSGILLKDWPDGRTYVLPVE